MFMSRLKFLALFCVIAPAESMTPRILQSNMEAILDKRHQPILPEAEKIKQKCHMKLDVGELRTPNATEKDHTGEDLLETNRMCKSSGSKFCTTLLLQKPENPSSEPHEYIDWSEKHSILEEYHGCYPVVCDQRDITHHASKLIKEFYGDQSTFIYAISHCDEDSVFGIGFFATLLLVGFIIMVAIVGTILDYYMKLSDGDTKDAITVALPKSGDNQNKATTSNAPRIVITCAAESVGSFHSWMRSRSLNSVRSDEMITPETNVSPIPMPPITSACSSKASADCSETRQVSVHSVPAEFSDAPTPEDNKSRFPALCGKSRSFTDLSGVSAASLGSVHETLNFSNPSIFVSPLQPSTGHEESTGEATEKPIVSNPNTRENFGHSPRRKWEKLVLKTLYNCSAVRNARTIFSTNQNENDIPFTIIHAVQTIAMWWFLLYEAAIFLGTSVVLDNVDDFKTAIQSTAYQLLFNPFLHLHTVFFTSAVLSAKYVARKLENVNSFTEVILVLLTSLAEKFFQQLPYYATVILCWTFVSSSMGAGPLWYAARYNKCQMQWWTVFLYISNFYPSNSIKQCMPWAWYAACDMQLFIVGMLLTALLLKYRNLGIIALIGSVLSISLLNVYIGLKENLSPLPMLEYYAQVKTSGNATDENGNEGSWNDDSRSFDKLLNKPHYNWFPYAIGLLIGLKMNAKTSLCRPLQVILGVLRPPCAACMIVILLAGSQFYENGVFHGIPVVANVIAKAWTLMLAIIVLSWRYASFKGPFYRPLSGSWWILFSRLNFAVFIGNPVVLSWFFYRLDYTVHFSGSSLMIYFLGTLTATYITIVICNVFVRYPFFHLLVMAYTFIVPEKDSPEKAGEIAAGRKRTPRRKASPRRVEKSKHKRPRNILRSSLVSSRSRAHHTKSFDTLFTPVLRAKFASPL